MTDSTPPVDPGALDKLLEMTGDDLEFLDELIQTFLADTVDQLSAMGNAAAAGSAEELMRPAHSLKSNAASMGAERLSALCRTLEADARTGTVPDAVARVGEAAAEFELVRTALAELRASA